MGFWSDFAATWNEVSDCTFNTIIYDCHEQSTKIGEKYEKLLQNPKFKTTREMKKILSMTANQARKEYGINFDEAEPAKPTKKTRKRSQPQQTN